MQDLNDFYFFAAVVNHGGFSAAARALKVPKSRLSKHVTALEQRLGVRLLERSTRKLRVTDLGQDFYRQCEAIVAGAEEAEALVARSKSEPHGTLRVSCPPGIATFILASILPGFMKANPRVRVELLVFNRRVDLIEERVDVAIRVRTELSGEPNLTVRMLGKDRIVMVASPNFVEAHRDRLTPEGLASMPTLSFTGEGGRDMWMLTGEDGRTVEVRHSPVLVCANFNVLAEAATAGLGVALMPDHACAQAIRAGRLMQVMPEWSASDGIVHLVFTSKRGMPNFRPPCGNAARRTRRGAVITQPDPRRASRSSQSGRP
jgi:DNA-binding transcriptional LysR family regulator